MDRSCFRRSPAVHVAFPRGTAHGFTLVEILIVLAVVGILAVTAIPHFSGARQKAYVAAMVSDLHAAAIYEEAYAAEHGGVYFSGTVSAAAPLEGLQTSEDVVLTLSARPAPELGPLGMTWTGVARHAKADKRCESKAGLIACTDRNDVSSGELAGA